MKGRKGGSKGKGKAKPPPKPKPDPKPRGGKSDIFAEVKKTHTKAVAEEKKKTRDVEKSNAKLTKENEALMTKMRNLSRRAPDDEFGQAFLELH